MFDLDRCRCQHCGSTLARVEEGRLKLAVRSRLLAVTKSGAVEMNCPSCRKPTVLPLVYDPNGGVGSQKK